MARSYPSSSFPTSHIALSLLLGFTLMLVIEQLILPHAHATHPELALQSVKGSTTTIEFDADAEQGDLEHNGSPSTESIPAGIPTHNAPHDGVDTANGAFPLTFGLVIHGLADGLALGVSSLPTDTLGAGSKLSFIVFLALLIHKGQTATLRLDQ